MSKGVDKASAVKLSGSRKATGRGWGMLGFTLAVAAPAVGWHGVVAKVASEFTFDARYLITGWGGFFLMALGVLLFAPVVWSIGRDPDGRFYPRSRNALAAWGVCLYLLGVALAMQVSQITSGWAQ